MASVVNGRLVTRTSKATMPMIAVHLLSTAYTFHDRVANDLGNGVMRQEGVHYTQA